MLPNWWVSIRYCDARGIPTPWLNSNPGHKSTPTHDKENKAFKR